MKWIVGAMAAAAIGRVVSGCTTLVLAPGAEQIKVTQLAADVVGCRAVGNVISEGGASRSGCGASE
jgi:hypothetical protein